MTIKTKCLTAVLIAAALCLHAAEIHSVQIPSASMQRDIPAMVLLPDRYTAGTNRYPVVYLLHGAGGSCRSWANLADELNLADDYGVVIVCPDAARTSWYFDSPIDPAFQFETHVAKECVAFIDETYRTKKGPQFRAVCGNSMGGHGALFLTIRHPDTFGTAVVLSGGVDIRPFPNNWDIKKRIGSQDEYPENWEKLTVINQAKQLDNGDLAISIDCGEGDFFLKVNRALHEQFIAAGIEHHYEENPGKHNWDYWRGAIQRQMPFIKEQFNKY